MFKKIFFIILSSILFNTFVIAKEGQKKEGFYSQLTRAVIRLEHYEDISREGTDAVESVNKSDGTSFFVIHDKNLYVVSARHVVEKNYDLHARVKCINNITGKEEVIMLKLPRNKWIFHPDGADQNTNYVDVAVMKIRWIKNRQIKHFTYELPESDESSQNTLPFEDLSPPTPVLVFGFPLNIGFELLEQKPFGRLGIISMTTGKKFLKIDGKFTDHRACIVDVEAFPGNSGSPVIEQLLPLKPEVKLAGLIYATNVKLDYAIMEPVSRIRETLDAAKKEEAVVHCWSLLNGQIQYIQ